MSSKYVLGLIGAAVFLSALIMGGCGVQKPTEDTLISTFDHDVVTYGFNRYYDNICSKPSEDGSIRGIKKINNNTWGINNFTIVGKSYEIKKNESDRFPYQGVVTYNASNYPNVLNVVYFYGKSTKTWMRKESITP